MIRNYTWIALVAALLLAPLSAGAAGISIANVSSSGSSNTTLFDGDVLTVDLVVENAAALEIYGLGLGVTGYDTDGDGTAGEGLNSLGGSVTGSLFNTVVAGPSSFGGLGNVHSAPIERGSPEIPGFPLPTPAIQVHTVFFEGAALSPSNGDGSIDVGIGGGFVGDGDVHFQVQFVAVAADVAGAQQQFTLDFGENGDLGLVAIGAGGEILPFSNRSFTLTVIPEPGTALLFGLGLAGLAAGRKRRA